MISRNIFVRKNKIRQLSSLYLAGRVFDTLNKRPLSALQLLKRSIKGIGLFSASVLAAKQGFNITGKLSSLGLSTGVIQKRFSLLETSLEKEGFLIDKTLDRYKEVNIDRKKKIGTLKGQRMLMGLPSRGQRTKTNAKTVKKAKRALKLQNKKDGKSKKGQSKDKKVKPKNK